MQGQTWKNLDSVSLKKIKIGLLEMDGENIPIKNEHEIWRVKISDSVFTAYKKGTLYSTPSNSNSKNVLKARATIDQLTGTGYLTSEKSFLIGFDETGKGEIAGPIILAGAAFPTKLFSEIVKLIGSADTKKSHNLKYWKSKSVAALGPSATGYLAGENQGMRYKWKTSSSNFVQEILSIDEINLESVYIKMRTNKGISFDQLKLFSSKFGKDLVTEWKDKGYICVEVTWQCAMYDDPIKS